MMSFTIEGNQMTIKTFGLYVSIIDFTLSRINTGKYCCFTYWFALWLGAVDILFSLLRSLMCPQAKIYSFWICPLILISLEVQKVIDRLEGLNLSCIHSNNSICQLNMWIICSLRHIGRWGRWPGITGKEGMDSRTFFLAEPMTLLFPLN